MTALYWITERDGETGFPHPETSMREPDGLLAAGGQLSRGRLLAAYRNGIFPWYEDGQPVLWWSPDPRTVLEHGSLRVSRSLRRSLKQVGDDWSLSLDTDVDAVIRACAAPRDGQVGTWITADMLHAYLDLHRAGYVHAVSVHADGVLIGGLYGVSIGRMFFGESMFSRVPDASKVALVALSRHLAGAGFGPIDCQQDTDHMRRLGAISLPRPRFLELLDHHCAQAAPPGTWTTGPLTLG